MSTRAAPPNLKDEEKKAWARQYAENLACMPSNDPNALKGVGFYVYIPTAAKAYLYPYHWRGKHVIFDKAMENVELDNYGNFGSTMFPHLQH